MNFQIAIFDGFDELDVIGVYEPLRMAGFTVQLMSLRKQDWVSTAHGLKMGADGILSLKNKPDILVVPGGGWLSRATRGAWAEAQDGTILGILKEFHAAGVILASVCAGAILLAKAGLLAGQQATTHSGAATELASEGANVVSARVIDNGEIITAGGVTSSLDLGLWLIERFAGVDKAKEISKRLEFDLRHPIMVNGNFRTK